MNDGVFDDLGGQVPQEDSTDAWDVGGAIYEPCQECGAERDKRCVNPITGVERHSPCVSRTCGKKPA
jgi:hypothetical protein